MIVSAALGELILPLVVGQVSGTPRIPFTSPLRTVPTNTLVQKYFCTVYDYAEFGLAGHLLEIIKQRLFLKGVKYKAMYGGKTRTPTIEYSSYACSAPFSCEA